MSQALCTQVWQLPPLILHPFTRQTPLGEFSDHARAALLHSVLKGESPVQEQFRDGRMQELRMLFYLGKDIFRWLEQCVDWSGRVEGLDPAELHEQSFAALLVDRTPENVRTKLRSWGVTDHAAIFSRAIGLKATFAEPPDPFLLEPAFIADYHHYADYLFACFQQLRPFRQIGPDAFHFEVYGSGEYSRMLETEWGG